MHGPKKIMSANYHLPIRQTFPTEQRLRKMKMTLIRTTPRTANEGHSNSKRIKKVFEAIMPMWHGQKTSCRPTYWYWSANPVITFEPLQSSSWFYHLFWFSPESQNFLTRKRTPTLTIFRSQRRSLISRVSCSPELRLWISCSVRRCCWRRVFLAKYVFSFSSFLPFYLY